MLIIFAWDLAVARITGVTLIAIAGCPQARVDSKMDFFVADVQPYTRPLGLAW